MIFKKNSNQITIKEFRKLQKQPRKKYKPEPKKEKKSLTYLGHKYDSQLEIRIAKRLELLRKTFYIKAWVPHPYTYDIIVNDFKITVYTPDFGIYLNNGEYEIIDTKGYRRKKMKNGKYSEPHGYAAFLLKRKLMFAIYGKVVHIITTEAELIKILNL